MIVERFCAMTEEMNTMDLPVTVEQLDRWQAGEYVQDVFPHLDATQREFLITGMTAEQQDAVYGEEPPEEMFSPSGDWGPLSEEDDPSDPCHDGLAFIA